jgi:hypothetical protein
MPYHTEPHLGSTARCFQILMACIILVTRLRVSAILPPLPVHRKGVVHNPHERNIRLWQAGWLITKTIKFSWKKLVESIFSGCSQSFKFREHSNKYFNIIVPTRCTICFQFITINSLYIFRELTCSSSGGTVCTTTAQPADIIRTKYTSCCKL